MLFVIEVDSSNFIWIQTKAELEPRSDLEDQLFEDDAGPSVDNNTTSHYVSAKEVHSSIEL